MLVEELIELSKNFTIRVVQYNNEDLRLLLIDRAISGRTFEIIYGKLHQSNIDFLLSEGLKVKFGSEGTPDVVTIIEWENI